MRTRVIVKFRAAVNAIVELYVRRLGRATVVESFKEFAADLEAGRKIKVHPDRTLFWTCESVGDEHGQTRTDTAGEGEG